MRNKYPGPQAWTPEAHERFMNMIRKGHYISSACSGSGLNRRNVDKWVQKGRQSKQLAERNFYTEFVEEFDFAMSLAEDKFLSVVSNAGEDDWRAAAWVMERRWADRWAKKETQNVTLSGDGGGPVQMLNLSTEEKVAILAQLTSATGEAGPEEEDLSGLPGAMGPDDESV